MDDVMTRWVSADVTLLPRKDGRPQWQTCIFVGYHCSNLRIELAGGSGWAPQLGGAYLYPLDHDELGVGETGPVRMYVYGEDALDEQLRVGAQFLLTEGGCHVVFGTVTALLSDTPDARSTR